MPSSDQEVVRRYYEDLWNRWDLGLAGVLLAPNAVLRGPKSITARNKKELLRYIEGVRSGFPDLQHAIEKLTQDASWIKARVAVTGTHTGKMLGVAPSGRRVQYAIEGAFRLSGGRIVEIRTQGDAADISRQIQGRPAEEAPETGSLWGGLREAFSRLLAGPGAK